MSPNRYPYNVTTLLNELDRMPIPARVISSLQSAARLVEFAAYEIAPAGNSEDVARLIHMAAEIERESEQLIQHD